MSSAQKSKKKNRFRVKKFSYFKIYLFLPYSSRRLCNAWDVSLKVSLWCLRTPQVTSPPSKPKIVPWILKIIFKIIKNLKNVCKNGLPSVEPERIHKSKTIVKTSWAK